MKPSLAELIRTHDRSTAKILSEVTTLNGRTIILVSPDSEEKITKILLRYTLELPMEVQQEAFECAQGRALRYWACKAQTRQVLVELKGTVLEELDLGNSRIYKILPNVWEPLRCHRCQQFGHRQSKCCKKEKCTHCWGL